MAKPTEIILHDLACTKNVCFSPVVWRIRLMLNYKQIPYETIFLQFVDIETTLRPHVDPPPSKYTVPVIKHVPTGKYIMDSAAIAAFLEATYPVPAVPLHSELGSRIEVEGRKLGRLLHKSVTPREVRILSPDDQVYFRRTREASMGRSLESLLEEEDWEGMQEGLRGLNDLIKDSPFILGADPSYTDFFLAGSLRSTKVVDEGIFAKLMTQPGLKQIYTACLPLMERET